MIEGADPSQRKTENNDPTLPSPTARPAVTESLRPPHRGDDLAAGLLGVATVLFAMAIVVLAQAHVIVFQSAIPFLTELNYFSLGLASFAFLWSWFKDWSWLHAEEADISALLLVERTQRDPKLLLHRGHTSRGKRGVETLLDDRVTRVVQAVAGGAHLRESELRAVAVWRSATLGSLARYASSLLLLMTVLGTFLGIKSSLGPLRDALLSSASGGTAATAAALATPLANVASAFGANLTALVGAITIGLGAWGLSVGRQNMLARLEQASSLYLYPQVQDSGPLEQLARAVLQIGSVGPEIRQASRELAGVSSAIKGELGGIRDSLSDQLGALRDSIGDFSAPISDSLEQTRRTLKALMEQQSAQVAEESRKAVDKVERQITDTTVAVQQSTALYASLVSRLQGDIEVISKAMASLEESVQEVRQQREAFGRYADSATQTINERLEKIEGASERQLNTAEETLKRYEVISDNLGHLTTSAETIVSKIAEADLAKQSAAIAESTVAAQEAAGYLEPTLTEVRGAISNLNTTLSDLPDKIGRSIAVLEHGDAPAVDPNDKIIVLLTRLNATLTNIEKRASRSIWKRVIGKGS
jgi:ABC-type transporter Mla subunit MlaD